MIKKTMLATLTGVMLLSGCASNGLGVNTLSNNKVDRYFKSGIVLNQKKVVINDKEMAVLTGAGAGVAIGAVTGASSGNAVRNGVIGGAIGGLMGAIVGKEVIAYETIIKYDTDKTQKCYIKNKLQIAQKVEFTVENKKCKNLNLIATDNQSYKKSATAKDTTTEQKIVKRGKRSGLWFYQLEDGTVVNSSKFYGYKGDIVKVKYLNTDNHIISIIRTKCLTCKNKKKTYYTLPPVKTTQTFKVVEVKKTRVIRRKIVKKPIPKLIKKPKIKEQIIKKETVKNVPVVKEVKKEAAKPIIKKVEKKEKKLW